MPVMMESVTASPVAGTQNKAESSLSDASTPSVSTDYSTTNTRTI